jgi:hypothetical protein
LVLALACAALLAAGCASVDTVKDARGQGVKRSYRQSYELVYQAALNSASQRNLEIVEQDRAGGSMLLESGVSWTSLGERIAVFVIQNGDSDTTVEIVSHAVLPGITFPPDWARLLHGDIEHELAALRTPK